MIAIAHFIAVTFYLGAAAIAALPFARRVRAPVLWVVVVLLLGIAAHGTALFLLTQRSGAASITGLGPALSFAGLVLAMSLVIVEALAPGVSVGLVAAPLATLDRVNHFSSIAGFLGLTLGLALAGAYSVAYHAIVLPQIIWGMGAWVGISALALGRLLRGWQAKRAAVMSAVTFASVLA